MKTAEEIFEANMTKAFQTIGWVDDVPEDLYEIIMLSMEEYADQFKNDTPKEDMLEQCKRIAMGSQFLSKHRFDEKSVYHGATELYNWLIKNNYL